jgi:hypothetical protein
MSEPTVNLMNIDMCCGICDWSIRLEGATAAQLEYLFDLYANHHPHTPEQVTDYIWANGNHPAGKALEYPAGLNDDDEDEDELPEAP